LDQVMRTRALEEARGQSIDYYVAIGGGAGSPLWRQMLADAYNKPDHRYARSLGAGRRHDSRVWRRLVLVHRGSRFPNGGP